MGKEQKQFIPIIGIIFLLVAILIGVAIWTSSSLKDWPLEMGKKMKALYEKEEKSLPNSKEVSNMKSVIYGDKYSSYPILDYYIASSYNSCAAGSNLDDYVSMGALETVIKQGARLIDLENIWLIKHQLSLYLHLKVRILLREHIIVYHF